MKKLAQLEIDFDKFSKNVVKKLMEAEKNTAESIWNDVIVNAPMDTGEYISSISVDDPIYEKDTIKTVIGSDLKTEDGYFLGRMLENGTGIYALEEHIGKTKTFIQSGYRYWYLPVEKVDNALEKYGYKKVNLYGKDYYVMHGQPAKPHFIPAYNSNVRIRKENIMKALREARK